MFLGEAALVEALQFEPEIRSRLKSSLVPHFTPAQLDSIVQEAYGRLLAAATRPFSNAAAIGSQLWKIVQELVAEQRTASPASAGTTEANDPKALNPELLTLEPGLPHGSNAELAHLIASVQQLPDRERQVFTLRKIYGYSHVQIAQHLKLSEAEVVESLAKTARAMATSLWETGARRTAPGPRRTRVRDRLRRRFH